MKKNGLIIIILILSFKSIGQNIIEVTSFKKDILLKITNDNNDLTYSINYKNNEIIKSSSLGFTLNSPSVEISKFKIIKYDTSSFSEIWKPVWGEVSSIKNEYKELIINLIDINSNVKLDIIFRVFNDGVAFRYIFPKQENLKNFIIKEENSKFAMSSDNTAFWMPGDYDTNEYSYTTSSLSNINALEVGKNEKDIAVQTLINNNTVQTPLMMKTPSNIYINIHEAALINYAALNLELDKKTLTFTSHLVPDAVGNKGYLETPAKTPWRTIIISDKATEILSSKMILNLNEPSKIENTDWIKPQKFIGVWWEMHIGKGTWEKASGKHSANTENVKKYIDFASKYKFDGVLVEGWNIGWEDWFGKWKEEVFDFVTPYEDFNIEEINQYASQKNVKIIMHHETSGSVTNYERRMDKAFELMKKYNINSVKTGYVGKIIPRGEHHDGQWMNNHYIRVAEKAAENKIMIAAHEPSHPTGLHRTYPNWLANEAARGNEYNNAPKIGIPAEHHTILPFTRLMGGPMDFTPGLFFFKLNKYSPERTTEVKSTLAKQLALYVTIYSPLQMAADLPENYENHLDAFQFIIDVPVDWDDTKILEAEPGDYITIARKEKGKENWFIGGVTDENSRTSKIKLDFLKPNQKYTATIYKDAPNSNYISNREAYVIENKKVNNKTTLEVNLAQGGGFAISIFAK